MISIEGEETGMVAQQADEDGLGLEHLGKLTFYDETFEYKERALSIISTGCAAP